jgi:hypothetical protein
MSTDNLDVVPSFTEGAQALHLPHSCGSVAETIVVIPGTCRADRNAGPVQFLRDKSRKENGVMSSQSNSFLSGPLGPICLRTALPIIFVTGMNGLLAVADALFLGVWWARRRWLPSR